MSYEGDSLMDLVTPVEAAISDAGRAMAEDLRDVGRDRIEQNTPVETAKLRRSYKITPVITVIRLNIGRTWEGLVYTTVDYAPHVEYGTGLWGPNHAKYKIEPKKPGGKLQFRPYMRHDNGRVVLNESGGVAKDGYIYRDFVMHPGSPGQGMFRLGAAIAEADVNKWSKRGLSIFAKSITKRSGVRKKIIV